MSLPEDEEGRTSGGGTSPNTKGNSSQHQWGRRGSSPGQKPLFMSGGHGKAPERVLHVAHPSSQAPYHSEDSKARSSQEPPRSSWKLLVAAKLPVASFPWVPWAALMARETAHRTYFKHQCNGLWPIEG